MLVVDRISIHAPLERVFAAARDVERWPRCCRTTAGCASSSGDRTAAVVEMAAWRPFGLVRGPRGGCREMTVDRDGHQSATATSGASRGAWMSQWSLTRRTAPGPATIVHEWDGPAWPLIGGRPRPRDRAGLHPRDRHPARWQGSSGRGGWTSSERTTSGHHRRGRRHADRHGGGRAVGRAQRARGRRCGEITRFDPDAVSQPHRGRDPRFPRRRTTSTPSAPSASTGSRSSRSRARAWRSMTPGSIPEREDRDRIGVDDGIGAGRRRRSPRRRCAEFSRRGSARRRPDARASTFSRRGELQHRDRVRLHGPNIDQRDELRVGHDRRSAKRSARSATATPT